MFNQLSDDDLDGDRYFISYNDYIINNVKETNCKPLESQKYSDSKKIIIILKMRK